MAHFALIDDNNLVVNVLVIEQNQVNTGIFGNPSKLIKTSYNTHGGIHKLGGTPLRKNFAGIGFTYDLDLDAFIPPRDFESWVLDENTCLWIAPIECPGDLQDYTWNEANLSWDLIEY